MRPNPLRRDRPQAQENHRLSLNTTEPIEAFFYVLVLRMLGPLLSCLQPPTQLTEPATTPPPMTVSCGRSTPSIATIQSAAECALAHPFPASLLSLKASRCMARLHDPLRMSSVYSFVNPSPLDKAQAKPPCLLLTRMTMQREETQIHLRLANRSCSRSIWECPSLDVVVKPFDQFRDLVKRLQTVPMPNTLHHL